MALTVETGTGASDADAFVSVSDCDTYCEARRLTDWTGVADSPPELKESAIRRATDHLSSAYTWKGTRLQGRDQALAWPRSGVEDAEGWAVASDALPVEIVQATCELAAYEAANPGGLTPAVTLTDRIKREQVGPLQVEYFANPMSAEAAKPVLTRVQALISGLLDGSSNPLVGTAARR